VRATSAWPTSSVSGRDAGIELFALAAVRYWQPGQIGTGYPRTVSPPGRRPLQLPAPERQFDIAACAFGAVPNRHPPVL